MSFIPPLFRQSLVRIRELPRYLRPQSEIKVFCIGFNKTATSSLHALFTKLGYRSYHGVKWRNTHQNKLLKRYDCFSDGIPDDFTNLDREFPGSKFILQVRETDRWLISRLEHIRRVKEKGYTKDHSNWLDDSDDAIRYWIERRNAHHLKVMEYFETRAKDFLIVNYVRDPAAASKICHFLGHADIEYRAHRNKNRSIKTVTENEQRIRCMLNTLGIPEDQYQNDILCPYLLSENLLQRYPCDTSQLEYEVMSEKDR